MLAGNGSRLLIAVVSGSLGYGGALLTSRFAARNEHSRFQRDKRAERFEELMKAVGAAEDIVLRAEPLLRFDKDRHGEV
jgi:hypothetical protein